MSDERDASLDLFEMGRRDEATFEATFAYRGPGTVRVRVNDDHSMTLTLPTYYDDEVTIPIATLIALGFVRLRDKGDKDDKIALNAAYGRFGDPK